MNFRNMRALAALIPLPLLVACATPYEQCVSFANRDVYQIRQEIRYHRANLSRGYAVHRQSVPYTVAKDCVTDEGVTYRCDEVLYHTVETPVAIDARAEERKLRILKEDLPSVERDAASEIRSCQAQYPEG